MLESILNFIKIQKIINKIQKIIIKIHKIAIKIHKITKMGKLFTKPEESQQQKLTLSQFYGMKESKNALYQSKISNKSSKEKILVKKIIPFGDDDQDVNSYLAKLQYLGQHIQGENLHLPVFCEVKDSNEFCTDYRNLIIYYENYDVRVKDQIVARKREYEHFSEEQIWYILYSITNALRKFQRFSMKSGKLNTQKILLNEKGHLKIINQLSSPETFQNDFFGSGKYGLQNFHAPEQLQKMRDIRGSGSRIKMQPNVCQTFSLGMIALQLTTFIEGDSFYDMKNKRINDKVVQKGVNMIPQLGYSKLMQSLIRVMISNGNDRPLPSQIYAVFKPYQKFILNLQRFQFETNHLYNSLYPSQVIY